MLIRVQLLILRLIPLCISLIKAKVSCEIVVNRTKQTSIHQNCYPQQAVHLRELHPHFISLPKHVCKISLGPNYDYSSTMRLTISSPLMPDVVVDYDLSNGKWNIVQ
ncbi:hypothetical protein REPUB_Repub08aG0069500 [Reevesia pubescens]